MTGDQLAKAALALVGTPFHLHGRRPGTGLDCIGVLDASFAQVGWPVQFPNGYTLRTRTPPHVDDIGALLGLPVARGDIAPGDILMLVPGICQLHFAIATNALQAVHAHAGLRKVVHGPLPPEWRCMGRWRLRSISGL